MGAGGGLFLAGDDGGKRLGQGAGLDHAALHDGKKLLAFSQDRDVFDGIAVDHQDVGELAFLDSAKLVPAPVGPEN